MADMGVFISFEGIDGCGKTTQIKLLRKTLEDRGIKACITKEPGGTEAGKIIRKMLLDSRLFLDSYTQLFLFVADRVQNLNEVIRPALEAGKWVLCDRFVESTLAYQGYGLGIDLGYIDYIHREVIGNTWPNVTFVLDCPVEVAKYRLERRRGESMAQNGISCDRYETKTLEFQEKLRKGYLELVERDPERIIRVDGSKTETEVHALVLRFLEEKKLWPLGI